MRAITASDLMNPEVMTVPEDMTVRALATFLTENEITGAPVVNEMGKLVGVVSVVDVAAVASEEGEIEVDRSNPDFYVREWEDTLAQEEWKDLHIEHQGLTVGDIMTPSIYSVADDAPVSEVASTMLRSHVHRLLVTRDEEVVGIVTTSDLLGLLVDEQ